MQEVLVPTPINDLMQAAVNVLAWGLGIVILALAGRVGIWLVARWKDFKMSQPEHVQKILEGAAKFGADFAEKVGPTLKEMGKEKMDAAIDAATRWLAVQGYEIDDAPLHEMIEVILFNNPDKYPSSKG